MEKRRIKIIEILRLKCPKCGQGKLFKPVDSIKDLFEMPEQCANCKQDFYLEPGFYWGAMYVAYAISSFICLSAFCVAFFLFGWTLTNSSIFFALMAVVLSPYTFRLSRSIWIHSFVKVGKSGKTN